MKANCGGDSGELNSEGGTAQQRKHSLAPSVHTVNGATTPKMVIELITQHVYRQNCVRTQDVGGENGGRGTK